MNKYMFTKTLGVIVGTLTLIAAIGIGVLSFISIGLSKNWNAAYGDSSTDRLASTLTLVLIVFLVGLITGIGSFLLRRKGWNLVYAGFCFLLGIGLAATFFISLGSIGTKNEVFILCIGMVYLLLGYLAVKKK